MSEARDLKAKIWDRDEFDWYVEPEKASAALFKVERFVGDIWDPCCGGGNIVRSARAAGHVSRGTDVVNRDPTTCSAIMDFLAIHASADNIVMNPPFFHAKGAEDFIRKAVRITRGKVAAFVDVRFIAGAKRAQGLFKDHAPARIWIVTPRVSCPPGSYLAAGNKAGNGSSDWCWLVWTIGEPARPTELRWLNVDEVAG